MADDRDPLHCLGGGRLGHLRAPPADGGADREVVEVRHGVGLRPQAHAARCVGRIADLAGPEEILVSDEARRLVEGWGGLRLGSERSVTLKGISGEHRITRIEWS